MHLFYFTLFMYIHIFCYSKANGAKVTNGNVTVTQGEDATMSCRIIETNDIVTRVTWQRRTGGSLLPENFLVITREGIVRHVNGLGDQVQFIGDITRKDGSIRMLNVSLMDKGDYTCIITLFPSGSFETVTKLNVQVRPKVTITPEAPPEVGKGEQVMATCTAASGRPPASVTWIVDHLNSTVKIQTNETHHSDGTATVRSYLIVVPTISMNRQEVQCVVNHTALKTKEVVPFRIQVHYPPHSVNIRLERSPDGTVFQCMADSSPSENTVYTWSRVNGTISSASVKNEGSRLMVPAASADLGGHYLCEVSNQFGRAAGSLFIYIGETSRGIYGVLVAFIVVLLVILIVLVFFVWKARHPEQRELSPLNEPQDRQHSSLPKSVIEEEEEEEEEEEAAA